MPAKPKVRPALWALFIVVDLLIVGIVLAALFWVAPVPPAFAATMAQARQAKPSGLVVAVVTADHCFPCQMYKRGALADARFATWVEINAGAAHLKWGRDDDEIAALHVDRYPATVILTGDDILATHYGPMSTDELLALLERAAASLAAAQAAPPPAPSAADPAAGETETQATQPAAPPAEP